MRFTDHVFCGICTLGIGVSNPGCGPDGQTASSGRVEDEANNSESEKLEMAFAGSPEQVPDAEPDDLPAEPAGCADMENSPLHGLSLNWTLPPPPPESDGVVTLAQDACIPLQLSLPPLDGADWEVKASIVLDAGTSRQFRHTLDFPPVEAGVTDGPCVNPLQLVLGDPELVDGVMDFAGMMVASVRVSSKSDGAGQTGVAELYWHVADDELHLYGEDSLRAVFRSGVLNPEFEQPMQDGIEHIRVKRAVQPADWQLEGQGDSPDAQGDSNG